MKSGEMAALVISSTRPVHPANTTHVPRDTLPNVNSPVGEVVSALAVHLVVAEVSLILHAGATPVLPVPMFASVKKLSLVPCSVGPGLHSTSGLLILLPLTVVTAPVYLFVLPTAVRAVAVPLPLVPIPGGRQANAKSMGVSVHKLALVGLSVLLDQTASSPHAIALPLAGVLRAIHLDLPLQAP